MLSDEKFVAEFNISNDKQLDMIIKVLKGNWIGNIDMFSMAANVAKHVEEISIYPAF